MRQVSNFLRESARVGNQWAFKHSDRSLLLKASMKQLSVGLLGREKTRVTLLA